jgi:hypothetical protein
MHYWCKYVASTILTTLFILVVCIMLYPVLFTIPSSLIRGQMLVTDPALYLPYLPAYAQILYVARGVAALAVALSFTIAVAIFASALRRHLATFGRLRHEPVQTS